MRSPTTPLHQKDTLIHFIVWAIPGVQEARHTSPAPCQSSSSSSSGTKMSCSSSTAAKFLLIWVPTYRKGTTTTAMRMSPNGVLCVAQPTTHTPPKEKNHRDDRVSPPERLGSGSFIRIEKTLRLRRVYFQHTAYTPNSWLQQFLTTRRTPPHNTAHLLRFGQNGAGRSAHGAPARCHRPPRHGHAAPRGAAGFRDGRQSDQATEGRRHVNSDLTHQQQCGKRCVNCLWDGD